MYIFQNIVGCFVLDLKLNVVDFVKSGVQSSEFEKTVEKLRKKHSAQNLPKEKVGDVLQVLKDEKYFEEFYKRNLKLTKQSIKESVNEDNMIMQAIANVNELDKVNNILTKRLREWYGLYAPEVSEQISDHEKFVELILAKKKKDLLKELKITESMGAELGKDDVQECMVLAEQIESNYALRKKHEAYLEKKMKQYCPNLLELAGVTIGAKLLELGKGLKRLALLPASTIQLLGAEKALFRHIKTGARSPKYGVIIQHPLIQRAPRDKKGKAARMLADKLSLCCRLDFFKGEMKAKEYRKELEEKLE